MDDSSARHARDEPGRNSLAAESATDTGALSAEQQDFPGVVRELGELGPSAIITEDGLARLFGRHISSVKRAVQRGELPPPTRLFGGNAWTVGVLIRHIETRLEDAAKEAARETRRLGNLKL
jgi:hypothetical protein